MITWQPNNEVRETGTVEGKRADSLIPCSQESATETRDLEQVYRELSPALRAYLTWKVGNPEQAEDLVQETFYRALKALQAGTGCLPNARKAYRPWLFRIATNLAIDLLRRRRCLTWCDLEAAATVPAIGLDADPEEVYPHLEVAEAVRTTLGQLPAHYCTSLVLHYQHGLTASQVAQMIGVTPGGVQDAVAARARGLCPALPRAGGGIRMTTATSPARTTTLRGTIYTLGYAQPDAAAQLERLMRDPQVCLVDIRLQPRSRRWPQRNILTLFGRRPPCSVRAPPWSFCVPVRIRGNAIGAWSPGLFRMRFPSRNMGRCASVQECTPASQMLVGWLVQAMPAHGTQLVSSTKKERKVDRWQVNAAYRHASSRTPIS